MFRCLLEVERSLEERIGIACLYSIRGLSPYSPENGVFGNFDALDSLEHELGQNATFEEEASAKP